MSKYQCTRCGHSTNNLKDFKEHLMRKKPCVPKVSDIDVKDILKNIEDKYNQKPFTCTFCNSKFSHSTNLYRHHHTCKQKPAKENIQISGDHNNVNSNNINITNITNNIVHINPPEYANSSFISKEAYEKMIQFVKRPGQVDLVLLRLVKLIYCNDKHPENYGVYIPNKKHNRALVWDGAAWKNQSINDAAITLRNKAYCLIGDYYEESEIDFGMVTQQEWQAFINRVNKQDNCVFKNTDKNIGLEILNHTPKVKEFLSNKKSVSDSSKWES